MIALAVLLAMQDPASTEAVTSEPAAPLAPAPAAPRRFVFAWLPSAVVGISPAPSVAPATLFLGGRLPRSWALGYQLTLSFGFADRYLSNLFMHRHHLSALHGFGVARRGLAGVGGGVAFALNWKPVVEVEGRVGVRFGGARRWAVGVLVRLGWDVGHQERAPMPQFGLFLGYAPL